MTYLDKTQKKLILKLLKENDYKCTAHERKLIAEQVHLPKRPTTLTEKALKEAVKIGGLAPGYRFSIPNMQTEIEVCSLYELPKDMVNPFVYCFGGFMTAFIPTFEIIRTYYKKYKILLPFFSSGKEGNKGLFEKVFYRKKGLIRDTEYDSYFRLMKELAGKSYTYQNYNVFDDTDTKANFWAIIDFAKKSGLKQITVITCSGNPFYDKRIVAEWGRLLLHVRDIKVRLIVTHTPLAPSQTENCIPEENYNSEIFLGYIAASIGPLLKDTVRLDGKTRTTSPERYFISGLEKAKWHKVKDIIVNYSNMGWPDYQEQLYHVSHKKAVYNVILADLYAKSSFSAEDYDAITYSIDKYRAFLGGKFTVGNLEKYLLKTPDLPYYTYEKYDFYS